MKTFPVVKNFKIFIAISLILMATGLAGLILLPFGTNLFNLDIDFAGGTTMTFAIHKDATPEVNAEIAQLVEETIKLPVSSVQKTGSGQDVIIKITDISTDQRSAIISAMQKKYNITDDDTLSVDNVSPAVGRDMQKTAVTSALLAAFLMLIYITIRFELTSGLAAVVCLLHDLIIMLSAYIIFQIPLNMNFIAAALTILGYSINAAIIVFDRIRENMRLARKEAFDEIVEKSIWQTMGRTINTTVTTLLTIGMIFIMGVPSLRNFALPLIIGILAGAYSSIFLSGPLWSFFRRQLKKKKA